MFVLEWQSPLVILQGKFNQSSFLNITKQLLFLVYLCFRFGRPSKASRNGGMMYANNSTCSAATEIRVFFEEFDSGINALRFRTDLRICQPFENAGDTALLKL
jgi:hypothetical protein